MKTEMSRVETIAYRGSIVTIITVILVLAVWTLLGYPGF